MRSGLSTALHNPERITLERYGAVGNREFFFVDAEGLRFGGSKKAPLMPIRAEHDSAEDRLTLRLPDGPGWVPVLLWPTEPKHPRRAQETAEFRPSDECPP